MLARLWPGLLAILSLLSHLQLALAQDTPALPDNRQPSLYTANYGDCQGSGSLINVTRFDAAYYADNLTVVFDLEGTTQLDGVAIMMFIGVFAYGESRFDLIFNPCNANIASACPLNSSLPLRASDAIHVNPSDVADIPSLAYSIPDFEGEAILRIFSNATHEQIGCFAGVVTNGQSFSQPQSVGSVLGIFTFVALVASFATAIYGEAITTMRLHYAHSLSVGVVFAVWQHIFFTGALSVNWPSVLVAWWSNFAWAGGMIFTQTMQNSINGFIGNKGDPIAVGAAGSGTNNPTLGGSNALALVYSRSLASGMRRAANHPLVRDIASEIFSQPRSAAYRTPTMLDYAERSLEKRASSDDSGPAFHYTGHLVPPGLPLPGNFSGFAGTLAQENIAASNAFLTGFLWFLILLVAVTAAVPAFKWMLEGLARMKWIKQDRLAIFRQRWVTYTVAIALRTCYLAFFVMVFLTIFQFTYQGSTGVNGIAAVIFIIFLLGIPGVAIYACLYKITGDDESKIFNKVSVERKMLLGKIPWFGIKKSGTNDHGPAEVVPYEDEDLKKGSIWKRTFSRDKVPVVEDQTRSIHDDEDFIVKFGWLAARFRRTRWWFFGVWLIYEFLRAVFYAGASGYALVQVFALLVIELVAFAFLLWARPFEGQRLNVIVVYCLSISKILSIALSAAFDVEFNLPRITTTAIGIVMIVIQGILTIITMIAIIVGAISSYMSVLRNREDFRPRRWAGHREKYFNHLDKAVQDLPHQPKPKQEKPKPEPEPEVPAEPHFEVSNFRRMTKIEDDGDSTTAAKSINSRVPTPSNSRPGSAHGVGAGSSRSRASSIQSNTQLPYGTRAPRLSWTMRDFEERLPTPVETTLKEEDESETTPPRPISKGHGRMSSRSFRRSNSKLNETACKEELAEEKKQETFEDVPAPTMRPRAGTIGSRPASRAASFHITLPEPEPVATLTEAYRPRRQTQPLTPAQEAEEFMISPTPDHEQRKD